MSPNRDDSGSSTPPHGLYVVYPAHSALKHLLQSPPGSPGGSSAEIDSSPASPVEGRRTRSPSPPAQNGQDLTPSHWLSSSDSTPAVQVEPESLVTARSSSSSGVTSSSVVYRQLTMPPPCVNVMGHGPPPPPVVQQSGSQGIKVLADRYLLFDPVEGSNLHRCLEIETNREYVCKVISNDPNGLNLLSAHYRVDGHPHINPVREVLVGDRLIYLLFPPATSDLHSFVRVRRRLKEAHARTLFRQIVAAVHEAHNKGIVLRDLKLRKFVFTSESRLELKLESLEDAVVLDDPSNDWLSDKHGCPAYVSPEILKCNTRYSGRMADMWGLGVMLYTMLVGRYPFHGQEHTGLFAKIRRGHFSLPDSVSSRAKCLIRCLLRKDPSQRLTTEDVLRHPWINRGLAATVTNRSERGTKRPASSSSATTVSSSASSGQHSNNPVTYLGNEDQAVPEVKKRRGDNNN